MVMQLTASQAKSIHITDWLDRGQTRYLDQLDARGNDGLFLAGQTGGNGVYFHGELKVKTEGGTVETIGNRLIVKDADTATLLLTAGTTFRYDDPGKEAQMLLNEKINQSYDKLKEAHIKDYQSLFDRVRSEERRVGKEDTSR